MSGLQIPLSEMPFINFAAQRLNGFIQSQLLAAIGFSQRDKDCTHQEEPDHAMNFGWARRPKRVAWIDEPIEDSDKAQEGGDHCGNIPAHNRAVGDRNIHSRVKRDMPQDGIEHPAENNC